MSAWPELLDHFHRAILDADASKSVSDVKRNPRLSPEEQMAIYIDGYRLRLTEAIRSDYPTLLYYLGDETFNALAGTFIEKTPPLGYNLDRYPHSFARFVQVESSDDFAKELALFEGAIAEVFMMEDSPAFTAEMLAGIAPEDFENTVFAPRSASRLLSFQYPVGKYLEQVREEKTPARPNAAPLHLYLVRHENEVKRHALDANEYAALRAVYNGETIGSALKNASEDEVQAWFGKWITHGFFTI